METYIFIALLIISIVFFVKALYFEKDLLRSKANPDEPACDPIAIPVERTKR